MSPHPIDPARPSGPMRLVLTTYPSREVALEAVERALRARLAACANLLSAQSRYWWKGRIESADEVLVVFKTVPKRVGALFRHLEVGHPYEVPELVEVVVPRVGAPYLRYLAATLDPDSPPPPLGGSPTRSGVPRVRAARSLGRTRGRHHRPSR